jgi:hypothetical protein
MLCLVHRLAVSLKLANALLKCTALCFPYLQYLHSIPLIFNSPVSHYSATSDSPALNSLTTHFPTIASLAGSLVRGFLSLELKTRNSFAINN